MLFLFDIDGTLLRGMPPAHRLALCDAAERIYGVTCGATASRKTAGMTDSAIARRMLLAAGVAPEVLASGLPAFYEAAADAYERHVPDNLRPYLTPHADESLAWLREKNMLLGLVTGNIQRIAWRKLAAAGLNGYFSIGAFGDEAEAREELPPRAILRAEQIQAADSPITRSISSAIRQPISPARRLTPTNRRGCHRARAFAGRVTCLPT